MGQCAISHEEFEVDVAPSGDHSPASKRVVVGAGGRAVDGDVCAEDDGLGIASATNTMSDASLASGFGGFGGFHHSSLPPSRLSHDLKEELSPTHHQKHGGRRSSPRLGAIGDLRVEVEQVASAAHAAPVVAARSRRASHSVAGDSPPRSSSSPSPPPAAVAVAPSSVALHHMRSISSSGNLLQVAPASPRGIPSLEFRGVMQAPGEFLGTTPTPGSPFVASPETGSRSSNLSRRHIRRDSSQEQGAGIAVAPVHHTLQPMRCDPIGAIVDPLDMHLDSVTRPARCAPTSYALSSPSAAASARARAFTFEPSFDTTFIIPPMVARQTPLLSSEMRNHAAADVPAAAAVESRQAHAAFTQQQHALSRNTRSASKSALVVDDFFPNASDRVVGFERVARRLPDFVPPTTDSRTIIGESTAVVGPKIRPTQPMADLPSLISLDSASSLRSPVLGSIQARKMRREREEERRAIAQALAQAQLQAALAEAAAQTNGADFDTDAVDMRDDLVAAF